MLIDGHQIGTTEDEIYLSSFFNVLKSIVDEVKNYDSQSSKFSISDLENKVSLEKLVKSDIGMIALPESFDDFIFRAVSTSNGTFFYWKIIDEPFFEYDCEKNVEYKSFVSKQNLELGVNRTKTVMRTFIRRSTTQ